MSTATLVILLLPLSCGQREHDRVRVTRGPLGPFAGANFPCDEQDAHRGAPWARGACLIRCRQPTCKRAIALCRRKPECSGVNINVEGTVATLKRATPLCAAARHSRRRGAPVYMWPDRLRTRSARPPSPKK